MVNKSIDIIVSINGTNLAGQSNAILRQNRRVHDISNKIKMDWEESLVSMRSWSVSCTGLYVINDASLHALNNAFAADSLLTVSLTLDGAKYQGQARLKDFQVNTVFTKGANYSAVLIGTGPLSRVEE